MIELKDISGNTVLSTPVNEGSKKRYTLMKEDSVTLRFSLETPIAFQIGTYIDDSEIGLYELTDIYNPAYNTSTGAYDYELRLDAYYFKWKNKIFKYTPENGGQEASWNLTAPLDVQMGVFLRNLSALGYTYKGTDFTFSIDSTVENSAKLMTYENTNMLDALFRMAETWGCECWITENVIHFGRCEYGTAVDFEAGKNVEEMASSGNRSTYATRIYAFGGTRNLPANYRPTGSGVTVNGVVQKRLMLPEGTPYIDAYPNMPTEQAVEQVVVFDDVYPKTNGSISSVSTYESTVNNEDGTQSKETFYRFKDNGITFSKDYMLENEELHVIFQSGSLNGMDFGVRFNPDNVPEKLDDGSWNPEAQLWEIVANEDYGRKLPDGVLNPEAGDTYVLYGWDSTKIADLGLVDEAERELQRKAEKYVEKSKIDPNTYQCKMMPDYMYGLDGNGNQNPNYAKRFDIGDRVNLINPAFFETGSRQSRIIGYELSLDMPYDSPVYSVGETAAYSRIGSIEEKVNELTIKGQTYTGGNGSGTSIYVIGTNDTTPASNRNVYSAYRSQQEFLNKRTDDRSVGKISSDKGFEVGNYVSGSSGGIFYVDKETGHTRAELDKLYVRMKAYFESLEIVNVNSIGGKQVISPAGSVTLAMVYSEGDKYKITTTGADGGQVETEVTVPSGVYRCMFLAEQDGQEVENRFKVGNQLQSKDFNITKPGEYNQVANHYYWRLVMGVSSEPVKIGKLGYHYVDLSVTDCDTGSVAPAKGDVVAQFGDRNDKNWQNVLVFSSVDTFSPSITLYQGIDSYSYLGKDVVSYGVDKTSGKAFFNVYGDMYIGDRDSTSYVRFTQGSGMKVKGDFAIDSTIGGKDITEYIKEHSGMTEEEVTAIVKSVTDDLQNQIDGTVETHFYSGAPSLSNIPASGWVAVATETNKETYDKHVGDLYYDKDTGYGYRFMKDGETYVWELLKDTDVTKALADAAKAQETADGKMKVFDHQPTDAEEYEVGDIWVNATYGNLYSNEILRSVTAKAVGAPFNISHWTKASKYTDDSKAEQVQANVDALSTTVNTMNTTVNGMKDFTDEAFSDGIVDRSEKSAIENYLNNIETTKAEVVESYGKVYGNSLLEGVAKTNLANAYTAFGSAVTELKNTINGAITDGVATSIERASVDQKYTNFNAKYGEFIAYLNAANKYIQDKINATANNALEKFTSLEYLKTALKENTEITGGLIQSSMLALGYTTEDGFTVMSGTNGIYDASKRGGGIASWWGGGMFDRFDYTESNMPANVATGLVRFDGTGYFAKGNLWWDVDGRIHADPQSFIINENQLGDYLELFQIIYRGNTKDIDYIIPQYPMQSLEVSTEIRVGNGLLKWDETNQGFYVEKYGGGNAGFYATSYLSAKGVNPDAGGGGGGGLVQAVYGYNDLEGNFSDTDLTNTFNAYTISKLAQRLASVESGALTSVDWSIINSKPTTLAGYGITDAKIANGVITLGGNTITPITSHQTLYTLTVQKNGTNVGTYKPDAAATINITDVASAATLSSHTGNVTVHITAAERTKWNKVVTDFAAITGTDSDAIINKWEEVIAFLDNYTEADTLSDLLSHKADKTVAVSAGVGLTGGGDLSASRTLSLAASGVTAGTYTKLTVDAYGRATSGATLAASDIPNLPWSKITSGKPTTLAGYGITDGVNDFAVSGAGNAFTAVSISGHTITLTKGDTFLRKAIFDDLFEKVNIGTSSAPVYAIRAKYGFYSDSFVSAKGMNGDSGSGGGGLIQTVYGYNDLGGTFSNSNLADTFNAYTINEIDKRLRVVEGGSLTSVDWDIITGKPTIYPTNWANVADKPSWIGGTKPSYAFSEIASKPTTIAGYGITDAYSHTGFLDNRSDNLAPYGSWAYKGIQYSLKFNTADGLSDGYSYHGSMTLHHWEDPSGGNVHQLGFTDNGNMWMRYGSSSWGAWKRFAFAGESYTKSESDNKYMYHIRGNYDPNNLVGIGVREVKSATNAPTGNYWHQYLTWGTADTNYVFQMAKAYTNNSRLYYRSKVGGTWYGWRSVAELSDLSNYYTKTESDSRYVNVAGDTMTETLNINVSSLGLHVIGTSSDVFIEISCNDLGKSGFGWINNGYGTYMYNYASKKNLGITDDGVPHFQGNTLWHAGNDGSGSGLDADLLDGYHEHNFVRSFFTSRPGFDCSTHNTRPIISFTYANNAPFEGAFIDVNTSGYGFYLGTAYFCESPLYYRRHGLNSDGRMGEWQQLARTIDNVASATKLQTARTLWGQSFDGTANVSGDMTGVAGGLAFHYTNEINSFNGHLYLNYRGVDKPDSLGTTGNIIMCFHGGNVGIGLNSSSRKLHVAGDVGANGGFYAEGYTGASWNNGHAALNVGIANNNAQTPLLLAYRYGTYSTRLFSMEFYNEGTVLRYCFNSLNRFTMGSDGTFWAATGIWSNGYVSAKGQNTSSDMRLKNKLGDISIDVRSIAYAPSFTYTWKDGTGGLEAGSSAQYWENVLPQLVKERGGYKEMAYGNIALLSAISLAKYALSIATRTETLEEKVNRLEKENNDMRIQIEELERRASA